MVSVLRTWANAAAPRFKDAEGLPLTIASVLVGGWTLFLIWGFSYPPFIDAANVAYSGEVMHDLWRGGAIYGKLYAFRPHVTSHLVFYWLYHCLRYLFAPVTCIKLLASLGVLGLALAMRGLLRAMNRTLWLSLPAFALAFNTNLNMGYLPFVIGIPLIPLSLMFIEANANAPRLWRWVALATTLLASLWVHFFLTAILLPLAALWSLLTLRGRLRLWVPALIAGVSSIGGLFVVLQGSMPGWRQVFQWIAYSERWDQLDRDVLQWTTDGAPALSFPWLLVAFVAALILTRSSPTVEQGVRGNRGALAAAALFVGYLLGPNYISWPEPAWGFGSRIGTAFALSLLLVPTTSATRWKRVVQIAPLLIFTVYHLLALVAPFQAYDSAIRPLLELRRSLPEHSKILPLFDSEWLKDPVHYSFGGFTGFVFRHAGTWLAVETLGYQPWSFCDAGYHPITCSVPLPAPAQPMLSQLNAQVLKHYDYVVLRESTPLAHWEPRDGSFVRERRLGQWSLWKNVSGTLPQ